MARSRLAPRAAATGLTAIAGLHLVWATGSPWPLRDSRAMAEAVAGRADTPPPGPAACVAVAGLLGAAACFVAGYPRGAPRVQRLGAAGVVAVLATRGALGLAGRTDVVSPGASSERFRALDRHWFSPVCLTLAVLAVPAVAPPRPPLSA